ncbi:hypothetical protein IAU60_002023 [Kwoniella sp. DSM 27419]
MLSGSLNKKLGFALLAAGAGLQTVSANIPPSSTCWTTCACDAVGAVASPPGLNATASGIVATAEGAQATEATVTRTRTMIDYSTDTSIGDSAGFAASNATTASSAEAQTNLTTGTEYETTVSTGSSTQLAERTRGGLLTCNGSTEGACATKTSTVTQTSISVSTYIPAGASTPSPECQSQVERDIQVQRKFAEDNFSLDAGGIIQVLAPAGVNFLLNQERQGPTAVPLIVTNHSIGHSFEVDFNITGCDGQAVPGLANKCTFTMGGAVSMGYTNITVLPYEPWYILEDISGVHVVCLGDGPGATTLTIAPTQYSPTPAVTQP